MLSSDRRRRVLNEKRRHSGQDVHLLANTGLAIINSALPLEAAEAAVSAASALLDGGTCRGGQHGQDLLSGERGNLGGDGHPSMSVALEGQHVGGASVVGLARDLEGDIGREENVEGGVDEPGKSGLPGLGSIGLGRVLVSEEYSYEITGLTYVVVHVGGTLKKDAGVVRELGLVDIGAVRLDVSAVVNVVVFVVDIPHAVQPIPGLLSPIGIGRVVGIAGKSSA